MPPVAHSPTGARTHVIAGFHLPFLRPLLLLLAAGLMATTAVAAPFNDNLADAEDLTGDDVLVSGDLRGATAQVGEPAHNGYTARRSVWWTWTSPITGKAVLTLSGQNQQPLVRAAIYRGTLFAGRIVELAEEDRGTDWRNWTFRVAAGTKYSIAVDVAEPDGALNPGQVFLLRLVASPDPLTFIRPTIQSNWMAPAVIDIEIASTHPKPLTSLELWNGTTLLKTIKAPPWTYRLTNEHGALYNLYAQGIDNTGRRIRSITNRLEVREPNDAFKDALVIPDTTTFAQWTSAGPTATKEAGEARHLFPSEGSLWWRWKAAYSGLVTFGFTNATSYNYLLFFRGDSVNALTRIAPIEITPTRLTYSVEAGTTYSLGWITDRAVLNGTQVVGNSPQTFVMDEMTLQAKLAPGTIPLAGKGPVSILISDPAGLDRYTALWIVDNYDALHPIPVTGSVAQWQPTTVGIHYINVYGTIPGRRQQQVSFSVMVGVNNDQFTDSQPLSRADAYQYTYTYPVGGASAEPGEPQHGHQPAVGSHWFHWTAPEPGRVKFSVQTFNALNPSAAVYEGPTLTSLVRLGETSPADVQPNFEIPVAPGHTYRLAVDDGFEGPPRAGTVTVFLQFIPERSATFTAKAVKIDESNISFDVRSPVDGFVRIDARQFGGDWQPMATLEIVNGIPALSGLRFPMLGSYGFYRFVRLDP